MLTPILRYTCHWLVFAALALLGVLTIPEDQQAIPERVRQVMPLWLGANWLPLFLLSSAAALGVLLLVLPYQERRYQKRLRKELGRSTEPGTFHETDADEALQYLLKESVWGWRQLAELNYWEMVAPHHIDELRRMALSGDLRTTAENSGGPVQSRSIALSRRYWETARISESSIGRGNHGVRTERADLSRPGHYSQDFDRLAVSTDDMLAAWPRASVTRRILTTAYIWLKVQWYGYGPIALYERALRHHQRWKAGIR